MRYDKGRSIEVRKPLLDRVRDGERLMSLGIRCSRTGDIARMASGAGYDLIWIDLEHSSMAIDVAAQIAATAHDLGLGAWVRTAERDYGVIGRLLDSGATGIIGPRVEDAADARALAAACRFPPHGQRSIIGRLPQYGFVRLPGTDLVARANGEVVVQALIESPRGVDNADEIAAVDGIDIVSLGIHDLAAELGCSAEIDNSAVMDACSAIAKAALRHGKLPVVGGVKDDDLVTLLKMGFAPLIITAVDTELLATGLTQKIDAWTSRLG